MSEPKKLSPEEIQALFAAPSNTSADSASTSEVEDKSPRSYGFFGDEEPPIFEDSNWAMAEAKALGLDVGVPMATGIAASPLLALGPKGWLAYAAIQAFSGSASNYGAQKIRNPEADVDFGENVASAGLSMIPGIAPVRVAKLGKPALMAVRGAEGAAMGASEAVVRQTIQIIDESNPREELDYFEIGFGSVFGSALGTGLGRIEASSAINRLGVSTSDAKKIQKRMEAEVAKQIARLDVQIKNAKQQGTTATHFQKERDALKGKLEDVSRTDREYLENLRKQAANKKEEIAWLADQQAMIRKEAGEAPLPKAPQAVADDAPTAPKTPFKKTTGDSAVDKRISRTVYMTPDEYLKQAWEVTDGRLGGSYEGWLASNRLSAEDRVSYVEAMKKGDEFPLPYIDKDKGSQDGRNRALAAKEVGIEKIPVGIIDEAPIATQIERLEKEITETTSKYGKHRIQKKLDALKEKQIEADAPTVPKAPTKETTQQPVSKFTKKQKLEALERMGMSDEDLGALIAGKTDILPVNLGAFTTDTDIQRTMASVLEQVEQGFKKRGVKTDKKSLIKQAAELRSKLDPSIDELAYAKQIANESEEIIFKTVVADSMTFKAFQDWNSKMSSDLNFNDPKVLNDLMADLDRLGEFAEASSTIGSSAGKLLQSRKVSRDQIAATISEMERKANKVEKEMTEELVKYSKDMKPAELKKQLEKLGGLKSLRGFAAELRLVRDPTKLGNLLKITRKSKLRKFADIYMELRYDLILSAPTTQGAAFTGNALMGTYSLLNQAVGGVLTGELASSRMALRTAKNLWLAIPDAYRAAKIAAKNSKGQMALSTHYEKVGGKALAMESTGLKGAVGETVENLGELAAFGPKGLVFQDEFYRHMFAKAQAKALIADEYRQLVKAGTAPAGKINEYIEGKLSAYFVNGQRLKTRQDVQLEAVTKAREQGLEADEARAFIDKFTAENWTTKLSSEMEYIRDVGDRVTFQQEISGEKGNFFEDVASKVSDLRNKEGVGGFVTQYTLPFIKTPVNIFKEAGGTASIMADIPWVGKAFKRSRAEFESSNPHIRAQARGRQIVGAGLWSTALYLAYNQVTTGSGPQNWKELQNKKNTGWLPNALNWSAMKRLHATGDSGGEQHGDSYVSLQRLDPLATVTGLASDLFRAHENNEMGEGADRVANTIMLALSEQVAQKSYLQTVGNALDAMSNGKGTDDGGNRFLKEIVRGNTPAILGNVSRSQDPYAREADSPLDVIRQRVLLDSRSLDPRRDIFGKEVPYNARATIREYNAVSPAMYSEVKMDEATWITQELDIVSNFPDSDKVIPGLDLKEINVTGSKHSLYDRLKQLYSETDVKKDVIEVYEDPDLARITKPKRGQPFKDYQKSAVMSVMNAYRTEALALLLDEYPELEAQYEHIGELTEQQLEGEELPTDKGLVAPELRQLLNQ